MSVKRKEVQYQEGQNLQITKGKKKKEKRRPKISKAAGNKPLFSRVGLDYESLTPLNPNGLLPRTDA